MCAVGVIRSFLGGVKSKLFLARLHRKWRRDASTYRKIVTPIESITLDINARFMILMPHSDDEWIGCSQVISKYKNVSVCNMDMSGDDAEEVHKIRYQEAIATANHFGYKLVELQNDKVSGLLKVIDDYNPRYILLPFYFDWHPEHVEVMKILCDALAVSNQQPEILMYQVSIPIPKAFCNYCLPMSKQDLKIKWSFFGRTYKTQNFMPVKRFVAQERINGGYCNAYAAEVFSLCSSEEWVDSLKKMLLNNEEVIGIKKHLNFVKELRLFVEQISEAKEIFSN